MATRGDNKRIQAMANRSRASVEKSARDAGVKNVGHKNRLQLAREVDRARKDARNARERGDRFAKRPEDKRTGKYRPRNETKAFWDAYKSGVFL